MGWARRFPFQSLNETLEELFSTLTSKYLSLSLCLFLSGAEGVRVGRIFCSDRWQKRNHGGDVHCREGPASRGRLLGDGSVWHVRGPHAGRCQRHHYDASALHLATQPPCPRSHFNVCGKTPRPAEWLQDPVYCQCAVWVFDQSVYFLPHMWTLVLLYPAQDFFVFTSSNLRPEPTSVFHITLVW